VADERGNSLRAEDENCSEDGGPNCKFNKNSRDNTNSRNSQNSQTSGGRGALAPTGARGKISGAGKAAGIDGANPGVPRVGRVNEGLRAGGGEGGNAKLGHEGSSSSTAGSRPRQGKEIQAPSGTKATTGAAGKPPATQREREEDDGGAAVLAARDDRQMEEFRAAKRFNCTGREPGLYADVNTGCKVSKAFQLHGPRAWTLRGCQYRL